MWPQGMGSCYVGEGAKDLFFIMTHELWWPNKWMKKTKKQGVCHTVGLSFTKYLKGKKKNYENSNISSSKNIIF
jgi:hypothetical protein